MHALQGKRLLEALEARAISSTTLATLIGVSKGAVSQYISETSSPGPVTMGKICAVLNLPIHFFTTELPDDEEPRLFWRSRASATKLARSTVCQRYKWFRQIVSLMETYVDFPAANFPDFKCPEDPTMLKASDIEAIASHTRRHWRLGDGPISSIVGLIENNGGVVVRNELGDERLDAFSDWDSGGARRGYIVLGTEKHSAVRSRFDACHELGHLVLHRNVPIRLCNRPEIHSLIEQQANRFAGAFLLPAATFPAEVYSASLDSLVRLKERWAVAISAMVMRLSDLETISDNQKVYLMSGLSARGWRRQEPLDDVIIPEQPKLLKRSLDLILDSGQMQMEEMILRTHLSQADIEKLLGVTPGYLAEPPASLGFLFGSR
jgi:Zn-dependent peptidase ImmA (M78 family)/transcriptional regulator with XRE-family HTH domain